MIIDIILSLV